MASKKVSKDTPLAEITLRKYEKPSGLKGRELIKKLCLSLGLLQPGDSRDVVVDVLHSLVKSKDYLSAVEIEEKVKQLRRESNIPLIGVASSNIRRQLKRIKDLHLIERIGNEYRINEGAKLSEIFNEKIKNFVIHSISERVREYIEAVEKERNG
ncbi:MAG: hypothetical protein HYS32_01110 [Candidatus Woesearchaeota archaeon]|nr:MAG: hypothetical protein HYS32_01110 [Candidatus Woesearchaeota archaeon]